MSSFWTLITSCCGAKQEEDGIDNERTALLNPDILPEAPVQSIGKSTEDQLTEQEALRTIFTEAADRFVDIESPSPFSRPLSSAYSSRSVSPVSFDSHLHPNSHNPPTQSRTSMWRPPNGESPIKVIHLGTHFEPHASTSGNRGGYPRAGGMRPPSSHSLKTLSKGSGARGRPSPLSTRTAESSLDRGVDRRESNASGESLYGTMTSYKTAKEGGGTVIEGAFKAGEGDARTALKDIFSRETGGEGGREGQEEDDDATEIDSAEYAEEVQRTLLREEELSIALKELEESMKDFKIIVTEPLIFDLGETKS